MHIEIFQGIFRTGEPVDPDRWYWRIKAHNGRIIADGGESYAKAANAKRAVTTLVHTMWAVGGKLAIKVIR